MPSLTFKLDKEKDIHNAWTLCNIPSLWAEPAEKKPLEEEYRNLWRGRSLEECRGEIWDSIKRLYSSQIVEAFRASVKKSWEGLNQEYFSRLERITGKPIYTDDFTAYITTAGRCPYDPKTNSFMISLRRPLLQGLRTAGHELMHLQFTNYFWNEIATQIGDTRTRDLNESLTVLLNPEFRDLWLVEDTGYPGHEELREFILENWRKEKDFSILLERCVNHLK